MLCAVQGLGEQLLDPVCQRFRISLEQVLRNNMKGKKNSLNRGCFHEAAIMEMLVSVAVV
jgi:hypothetical protein